ncbi:MAG: hypothetical protein H7039_13210 [Bryobacteraceae bacterium]|nr:hypothetical protein [Bryobacteraceae bacterium]
MRRVTLLLSLLAFLFALQGGEPEGWRRREQLQHENLLSVRSWFLRKNGKLARFSVEDKRLINGAYSMMVVRADEPPQPQPQPQEGWFGVFVVYGKTNQVYLALDVSVAPGCCMPELENPVEGATYVHWFADYGLYRGTYKYTYDLAGRTAGTRRGYRRFSIESSRSRGQDIAFAGEYANVAEIGLESSHDRLELKRRSASQRWSITKTGVQTLPGADPSPEIPQMVLDSMANVVDRRTLASAKMTRVAARLWLYVEQGTMGSVGHSGIHLVNTKGTRQFYPVPVPTPGLYQKHRTGKGVTRGGAPQLENHIGPFAFDGERVWFANQFYDGEGTSGVGAIGSFDIASRRYQIRYLPHIVPWSGSALLEDGDSVWIGLMRQPEGVPFGGGVLEFSKGSGSVLELPIKDYVTSILRVGDVLYFGTTHGLYTLDVATRQVVHIRIEPGPAGVREIVTMPAPLP